MAKENEFKILSFVENLPTSVGPMLNILVVPAQSAGRSEFNNFRCLRKACVAPSPHSEKVLGSNPRWGRVFSVLLFYEAPMNVNVNHCVLCIISAVVTDSIPQQDQ